MVVLGAWLPEEVLLLGEGAEAWAKNLVKKAHSQEEERQKNKHIRAIVKTASGISHRLVIAGTKKMEMRRDVSPCMT